VLPIFFKTRLKIITANKIFLKPFVFGEFINKVKTPFEIEETCHFLKASGAKTQANKTNEKSKNTKEANTT
jgi:hypothetical protein